MEASPSACSQLPHSGSFYKVQQAGSASSIYNQNIHWWISSIFTITSVTLLWTGFCSSPTQKGSLHGIRSWTQLFQLFTYHTQLSFPLQDARKMHITPSGWLPWHQVTNAPLQTGCITHCCSSLMLSCSSLMHLQASLMQSTKIMSLS